MAQLSPRYSPTDFTRRQLLVSRSIDLLEDSSKEERLLSELRGYIEHTLLQGTHSENKETYTKILKTAKTLVELLKTLQEDSDSEDESKSQD